MSHAGTILLVDDDTRLRGILRANFEVVGYDVVDAHDADGALAALDRARPDAIVVDVLPVASDGGPATVRRIRTHPQGSSVPLIVLTARTHAGDAVRSLEAGADDVVTKPFAPEEVLARVRGKIKRAAEDAALQPLTKLPANGPIEAEIRARLAGTAPWAVLYADLDGFKAFNDAFGFAKGDEVIKLLARTILDGVASHGAGDDFIGHVGGDDFVVVMRPARAQETAESICAAFDRGIRRVQRDTRVPYCTVSIAVLNGTHGATTYERIGERAALVKKEAKRRRGSAVVREEELDGPRFRGGPSVLALALATMVALGPSAGLARSHIDEKIQQQKAHIHAVHAKLHEKRTQLDQVRAKVGSIQAELNDTNRNIASVNGHLAEITARIVSTQRKLAWNRIQLAAAKATLRRHQDALNRRLVDAYEHGDLGYIDVLLRAQSFGDFVERWNDVRYLIKANESTIRARKGDEAKVVAIQSGLLGTQSELQSQEAQARQQRLALDGLARQRTMLLASADAERKQVQSQVNELDEMSAEAETQLEALIQRKQEDEERRRLAERQARQLAGEQVEPEPGAPGQLMWPASGPITSPFGMRNNPVTHIFRLHAGIDIGVNSGTTVAAAAGGRVIVAGWDDGGCGNMIVIDHGGRLATQYCHLSQIFVGVNQDVQRGQAIAASGSTGNSTGPHLHFGVRVNGRPVDPMSYLR